MKDVANRIKRKEKKKIRETAKGPGPGVTGKTSPDREERINQLRLTTEEGTLERIKTISGKSG